MSYFQDIEDYILQNIKDNFSNVNYVSKDLISRDNDMTLQRQGAKIVKSDLDLKITYDISFALFGKSNEKEKITSLLDDISLFIPLIPLASNDEIEIIDIRLNDGQKTLGVTEDRKSIKNIEFSVFAKVKGEY